MPVDSCDEKLELQFASVPTYGQAYMISNDHRTTRLIHVEDIELHYGIVWKSETPIRFRSSSTRPKFLN